MAITIQLRRDTAANFNSANTVPAAGEILLATDTHQAVIGDGSGQDFEAMVTANKFFRFEDGDGGRVFGGNEANETITIKGHGTQTVPIFKVVNSSDQSIVEVTDNDTQLVKIDSTNADTGDINLLLKAKASQTGEVIAVTDSGDVKNFTVKEDGQTLIDPNDTTDPSLKVVGSGGSQSNGILRVEDTGNNAEFVVSDGGATVGGTLDVSGTLSVDTITEKTADNGIAISKPISVTGNITGSANVIAPNHRGQVRITQSSTVADTSVSESNTAAGVASIAAAKVTTLAVNITPTSASSKILIETSVSGHIDSVSGQNHLVGTIVRTIGGSDVDLAGSNTSAGATGRGTVKGLCNSGSTEPALNAVSSPFNRDVAGNGFMNFPIKFLDTPNTTNEVTYTFALKCARDHEVATHTFKLNQNGAADLDVGQGAREVHVINTSSMIMVTEIPQ